MGGGLESGIKFGYSDEPFDRCGWMCGGSGAHLTGQTGIIEFHISYMNNLFDREDTKVNLALKVKNGDLPSSRSLALYSVNDKNENGIIESADMDINGSDYIGETCTNLDPGDTVIFDVTSAIVHDLFGPDQTFFFGSRRLQPAMPFSP